ncbi:MAG: Do family serine endopeptidase [Pseudomonadota bacterium]
MHLSAKKKTVMAAVFGLIAGIIIAITAQTQANLPIRDSQGMSLPSLAPMLEKNNGAVVSISVTTQRRSNAQNPLLNDPFFRQFFNVPDNYQPKQREAKSAGSGVIIDASKGIVVTNHHVIKNANKITVNLTDGRKVQASLVGSDPEVDIAVLKIKANNLKSLPLANSDNVKVGDFAIAIGNPFGLGQTVTTGIVSALGRSGLGIQGYENFIQTDASINPGNSGGALVNLKGQLIGINTAIIAPTGGNVGIGFAIPTNMMKYSTDEILKHGKVSRGQLGVYIQALNKELAIALGAKSNIEGVVISRVADKSPAKKAGLKEGDIITHINKQPIKSPAQLRNAVGIKHPGDTLSVNIIRDGRKRRANVTIKESVFKQAASTQPSSPNTLKSTGSVISGATLSSHRGGVRVNHVQRGSKAASAGLRANDLIIGANRIRVTNERTLAQAIARSSKRALLQVKRGNTNLFLIYRR